MKSNLGPQLKEYIAVMQTHRTNPGVLTNWNFPRRVICFSQEKILKAINKRKSELIVPRFGNDFYYPEFLQGNKIYIHNVARRIVGSYRIYEK